MGGSGDFKENIGKLIAMYIPRHFRSTDQKEITAFMQRFNFGTLITAEDNIPTATHLPFLIEEEGDRVVLSSHFARANPQAATLEGKEILVIFSEPHAYISPAFYEKEQNVPTWNYVAVHAYGKARIISDEIGMLALLEKSILAFDADYMQQWQRLSEDYKSRMLKGIVAFQIEVTNLEGKKKLSQNKTQTEQQRIIDAFSRSEDQNEIQIAEYMKLNNI